MGQQVTTQYVVWIGSTLHGLDDVYGPFGSMREVEDWLRRQPRPPREDEYLILTLQSPRSGVCC